MDLIIRTTGTLDLTAAAVTSASDLTPLNPPDDLPQLVLGTTEPITVKFVSAASTFEAWSDDPTYTVYASLGVVTSRGTDILSESVLSTVISDGKSGDLPVNTDALASYVFGAFAENRRANTVQLTLQITVADSNGDRRAYAMLPVTVWGRVASFDAARASIPSADVVTRTEVLSALSDSQTAANAAAASAAAALVSQNAAAASESDAEAAEIDAEAAAVSANASKLAAAASASAALASQGTAASSESVAIVQAAAASASASAASGSASAAASSASSAALSASSASTSATTALNAIISTFKGGVAGGSVPATSTAAGDYYRITSAGTSQSKTWATGDLAIYNGTSGSWTQVSGGVTDPASLAAWTNTKTPRGGIAFDGTANSKVTSTLTNQAITTDPFSVTIGFSVPSSNPSATRGIFAVSSSATGAAAYGFDCAITTAGVLVVAIRGAALTDYRVLSVSDFVGSYAGKIVQLGVVRPSSGDVVLYINGTTVTAAETTGGAPPTNWQATVTSTYFTYGTAYAGQEFVGTITNATFWNLALSAADCLEIAEAGGAVPYRFQYGSQSSIISNGDFASSAGWTTDTGWSIGSGVATINTSGTGALYRAPNVSLKPYRTYRVTYTISGYVSGGVRSQLNAPGAYGTERTANGTYSDEITTISASNLIVFAGLGAETQLSIDNVSLTQIGAICHFGLDEGMGLQLHDSSTNKLDALMTVTRVQHLVPKESFFIRATTNTNGNQQLLGGTALGTSSQQFRIRSWTIMSSSTPTVSLGNASGGDQYVSGAVLVSSPTQNEITLLTRTPLTQEFWCNSNSTATLQHTIWLERIAI